MNRAASKKQIPINIGNILLLTITSLLSATSAAGAGAFLAMGELVKEGSNQVSSVWLLKCRGTTVAVLEPALGQDLSLGRTSVLLVPKETMSDSLPVFSVIEQHAPREVQSRGSSGSYNPALYSGPQTDWSYLDWAGTAQKKDGVELGALQASQLGALPSNIPVAAVHELFRTRPTDEVKDKGKNPTPPHFQEVDARVALESGASRVPQELSIRRHEAGVAVRITGTPGFFYTLWAADEVGQTSKRITAGQLPTSGATDIVIATEARSRFFTVSIKQEQ